MATMNVDLPKPMLDFVDDMVAEGRYASSSEVVGAALRLLRDEQATRREETAVLRRAVGLGLDDAAAGRFSDRSVLEIAAGVLGKASRR